MVRGGARVNHVWRRQRLGKAGGAVDPAYYGTEQRILRRHYGCAVAGRGVPAVVRVREQNGGIGAVATGNRGIGETVGEQKM